MNGPRSALPAAPHLHRSHEWSTPQVPRLVAEEFCQRTRRHLGTVLSRASKDLDVRLLLHVMQKTLELEVCTPLSPSSATP